MFRARQYAIFFFSMVCFFALLIVLFYRQVVNSGEFSRLASEQHDRILRIEPRRGAIYDRYMEPLAVSLDRASVYADPRRIKNKPRAARILADALDIDEGVLLKRFQKDRAFVWVKRKISAEKTAEIKALDTGGIYFVTESERNYPNNAMAAHIIGFAGMDNNGLEGLELLYDKRLKGRQGFRHLLRDARSRPVLDNEEDSIPPQDGYTLGLTIDSVIQYIVEEEIEQMAVGSNASSAFAVVMEPFTGKILALANYPAYDLNEFAGAPGTCISNSAISNVFEPGSVFKIVTASAALNEGLFQLSDKIYCEKGLYRVGGRMLHDYHPYGELSFKKVIAKSSNIGTVKIAYRAGERVLYDYIKRFGFGEKTGVDLPGEVSGICRSPAVWSRSDMTTIPIGQGIAVTAIQLACAVGVIANGGYLMRPYVVDHIATWDGEIFQRHEPFVRRKVLDSSACAKMREVLRDVVVNGTGRRAGSDICSVCGKTGTGQMVDPGGGYFPDKYNATFVGFAPEDNPVVSIVVTARDPHPVHFGGSVAGPAFRNIVERTIQYLERNVERS